jgi:uncharacterized protein YeaO (DUF488 family)
VRRPPATLPRTRRKRRAAERKRSAREGSRASAAYAAVGIAIGAGTDVAVEAGDIVLVRSDPRAVPAIIELSKASYRKMSPTERERMTARRTAAGKNLTVRLKRAYDRPTRGDGPRVLVDRVWPRGMAREKLEIDAWMRDLGPSDALRRWFGHDPVRWPEFRRRYLRELAGKTSLLQELAARARGSTLTLVYSARDPAHNQAVVIREVLERDRA